ncbi:cytochrome P450 CYP4/CYP19/CYP26 subfamily [Diaporthe eres]|nr:cytochrome P450 CYP4/CYP19/CYP26 subfamily [Diaporthe eres]
MENKGTQKGCKPAKFWPYKWPFAVDMLIKIIKGDREMRLLTVIKECCDKTCNSFEQQLLGGWGVLTAHRLLSDYGLGLRIPTFHPLLGSRIFTQDGEAWKSSRNLVRPYLAAYRPENFERIQACKQSIIDSVPDDGPVDLQPLFFKLTFETTMLMLFGDTVMAEGWDEEITSHWSAFAEAFSLAQDYLATRRRFGQFYWLIADRKFLRACRVSHEFMDRAIARYMDVNNNSEELTTDGIRIGDGTDICSFVGACQGSSS